MTARHLLALASQSVARAERGPTGQWAVERVLTGQDVRCLEVDPLNPEVIYAGTQGQGVFCSVDGGRNWRQVGLRGVIVKSLAAHGLSPIEGSLFDVSYRSPDVLFQSGVPGFAYPRRDPNPKVKFVGALLPHKTTITRAFPRLGAADRATGSCYSVAAKRVKGQVSASPR